MKCFTTETRIISSFFFSIFKFGSPSEEFQLYTLRGDDNVLISHIVYRFD